MPLYEYTCPHGPHRIEILVAFDRRPDAIRCKVHDVAATLTVSLPAQAQGCDSGLVTGNGDMRFPYTSDTFGCVVESMAHHRQLCEKHNLEWAPDYDGRAAIREAEAKASEEDAIAEDYYDQLENSPAYAKFRDLRSKGYFDPTPEEITRMRETFEASQVAHIDAITPATTPA